MKCETPSFNDVREILDRSFGVARTSDLRWIPQTTVPLDEESALGLLRMIDMLEESDDVQSVHANFEVSSDVMEKLGA